MVVSSLIRNRKSFLKSASVHFLYFICFCFTFICDSFAFRHLPHGFCKNISLEMYNMARTHFKHCWKSHLLFWTVVSLKSQCYWDCGAHTFNSQGERGKREHKSQQEGELQLWDAPHQTCEENYNIQKFYRQLGSLDTGTLETAQAWTR